MEVCVSVTPNSDVIYLNPTLLSVVSQKKGDSILRFRVP